jgi:transglutaminase-like putative cysteine protease
MEKDAHGRKRIKSIRKAVSGLIALAVMVSLLTSPASAASSLFVDNSHWREVSDSTVTQLYNNKSSFVVMFFRYTCFNSNLRKVMVSDWMTEYNLDVYGVDVDQYNIPSWVWAKLPSKSVTLPVICIVRNGNAKCFTADDSMRSIQKELQEDLGIYDETEVSFSKLDTELYAAYSTRSSTASAQYSMSLSEIPSAIQAEAKSVVSGKTTQREQAKAIYDWVTTNIYYNYGMLNGTVQRKTSALETYTNKNSVCLGYANLTAAMCNAVGIPCRVVTGFATGVDTESTVNNVWKLYKSYLANRDLDAFDRSMAAYENHAWNEAYIDGEWLIMDTTWGSNNEYYPNAGKITAAPTDAYFDPDLEWFSESHLFWTDYSSDLSVNANSGVVTVTGKLDAADVASAGSVLLASFDADGKMLECVELQVSGTSVSQTLRKSETAVSVKAFLVDRKNAPAAAPYFGKVMQ